MTDFTINKRYKVKKGSEIMQKLESFMIDEEGKINEVLKSGQWKVHTMMIHGNKYKVLFESVDSTRDFDVPKFDKNVVSQLCIPPVPQSAMDSQMIAMDVKMKIASISEVIIDPINNEIHLDKIDKFIAFLQSKIPTEIDLEDVGSLRDRIKYIRRRGDKETYVDLVQKELFEFVKKVSRVDSRKEVFLIHESKR